MEEYKPQTEKNESELKRYFYRDGNNNRNLIFECIAKDILEADKLYQEKTGNNPEKQNSVLCSWENIKKEEK